jgi:intracellular septation protein
MTDQSSKSGETAHEAKPLAKFLIEFAPLVAFVVTYFLFGMFEATAVLMAATVLSMVASRLVLGSVTPMLVITTAAVCLMGALTFWFNDPRFFKVKPTIVNLAFAAILFLGLATGRPLLKMLMGEALQLDEAGWRKFSLRWALFFCAVAALNEIVWRNFSESTWVLFKFGGIIGLTFVFVMSQIPMLQRHRLHADG